MGNENLISIKDKSTTCAICKYGTLMTSRGVNAHTSPDDYGCYYAGYKDHTRRLQDGKSMYEAHFCDKFKPKTASAKKENIERNKITIGAGKRRRRAKINE